MCILSPYSKVKGADAQEKIVYGIIEEAGNKGMCNPKKWT